MYFYLNVKEGRRWPFAPSSPGGTALRGGSYRYSAQTDGDYTRGVCNLAEIKLA